MWVICIIVCNPSIINTLIVLLRKHIKVKIHVSDLSGYAIILGISYKEELKCKKKKMMILHPENSKSCMVVQITVLRRQIEICVTIHACFSQLIKWDLRDSTLGFEPRHTLPDLVDLWNCEGIIHNPRKLYLSYLQNHFQVDNTPKCCL